MLCYGTLLLCKREFLVRHFFQHYTINNSRKADYILGGINIMETNNKEVKLTLGEKLKSARKSVGLTQNN